MGLTPDQMKAAQLFYPYAANKVANVLGSGTRFVHYTTAEVAANIIREREVWMRKSSVMNDFLEIEYGLNCLNKCLDAEGGGRLRGMLETLRIGLTDELRERFNSWLPHFRSDTYLCCISEHLDEEDRYGRLSMWRAYGGSTGVAVVLNNTAFTSPSDALKAYTTRCRLRRPSSSSCRRPVSKMPAQK